MPYETEDRSGGFVRETVRDVLERAMKRVSDHGTCAGAPARDRAGKGVMHDDPSAVRWSVTSAVDLEVGFADAVSRSDGDLWHWSMHTLIRAEKRLGFVDRSAIDNAPLSEVREVLDSAIASLHADGFPHEAGRSAQRTPYMEWWSRLMDAVEPDWRSRHYAGAPKARLLRLGGDGRARLVRVYQ